MLRLRFAPLSMTGVDAPGVMLSEAKHPIPLTVGYLGDLLSAQRPLQPPCRPSQ